MRVKNANVKFPDVAKAIRLPAGPSCHRVFEEPGAGRMEAVAEIGRQCDSSSPAPVAVTCEMLRVTLGVVAAVINVDAEPLPGWRDEVGANLLRRNRRLLRGVRPPGTVYAVVPIH